MVTKGMFWKRFYFVVILLLCNCFLLCCNGFCDRVKKFLCCRQTEPTTDYPYPGEADNLYDNNNLLNDYYNNNNIGGNDGNNNQYIHGQINFAECNISVEKNILHPKFVFLSATTKVGKTSILKCLNNQDFVESYSATVGVEFFAVNYKDENSDFIMNMKNYGCSGDEKYKCLLGLCIASANAIVFVYDITNMDSFDSLEEYIKEVKTVAEEKAKGCLFSLLGNKLDLVEQNQNARQVTTEEAQKLAVDNNLIFLGECSAKDNTYIPYQKLYCKIKNLINEDLKCTEGLSGMLKDIIFSIYKHK